MSVLGKIQRTAKRFVYRRRFGATWAAPLVDNNLWPLPGASVDSSGHLFVPDLGTRFSAPNKGALILLRMLSAATGLHQRTGGKFEVRENEVGLEVEGVYGVALLEADIGVFAEVFVERLYRFELDGPALIFDIGANIGAASLYFAKHYGAEVHAFELVPSTVEIAKRNLQLNPDLASQVHLHAFGLADADRELDLSVDPAFRPSNSLYEPMEAAAKQTERVSVRDAGAVFEELLATLDGRKLVVKIDAEGAEYEIVQRLAETGQLSRIDLLLIEWHPRKDRNPEELRETLRQAGFRWFEREHPISPVGLINAYRV